MKIFISWSGETSQKIGEAFRNWIPDVLQFAHPYFTPNDVEKGQRWSAEIAANLEESKFGLFCITAENLHAPWLMFEAGAISKSTASSRVCPLLFGVEPAQLTGPLLQFQATAFSESEVFKFISMINELYENPLQEAVLNRSFKRCWPELEEKINSILQAPKNQQAIPNRTQAEIIEEILFHVRNLPSSSISALSNHWLVHFQHTIDFAEQYLKNAKNKSILEKNEQAKLVAHYLKLTFNLIYPHIQQSKNINLHTARGQKITKDIDKLVSELEDEMPF